MPICSMTGFGRSTVMNDGREITVEIKSVNHRFLDLSIRTQKSTSFLEETARGNIQRFFARGHFDVFIYYNNTRADNRSVSIDENILNEYIGAFKCLHKKFQIKNDIKMSDLIRLPEVFTTSQREEDQEAIVDIFKQAVEQACQMNKEFRLKEGEKLRADLLAKLNDVETKLLEVDARAPQVVDEYRIKLQERITDLLGTLEVDPQRIAQEVAMFADKSAIDEEIVRMKSHIKEMRATLDLNEPVGRKLDFITQEMNREINTIGSKANDLILVNLVVSLKNDLEKIREQVQNIE